MSNLKIGVEVVSAHDLIAKDGNGSANAFVELHYDGQRFRTTVKEGDLNPYWNEQFFFTVSDPSSLSHKQLEAYVYHIDRTAAAGSTSCIGKVRIAGTSFVPYNASAVFQYPLERSAIFSRAKGELSLRVFLTDDPSIRSSNPAALDPSRNSPISIPGSTAPATRTFSHPSRDPLQPEPPQTQPYYSAAPVAQPPGNFYMAANQPPAPGGPQMMRMFSSSPQQPLEFQVKETSPYLGGGRVVGGRVIPAGGERGSGAFDLVEKMEYLFVRVVKARELPWKDLTGGLDPYVEVKLGNYKGTTKHFDKNQNPEWNEVFAFSREKLQASFAEIIMKDKDLVRDDFVGVIRFDLNEIPRRVPPDSPLAPEWYRLEDKKGEKIGKGELMLAIWFGTQADEAFAYATHSDGALPSLVGGDATGAAHVGSHLRAKVYHAPRLWYVRVNVIEAHDIVVSDKNRVPNVFCRVTIGNQMYPTTIIQSRTANFGWNQEFMLVAAEPLEEHLILSVEDRVGPGKEEVIGHVHVPLATLERRLDDRPLRPQWYSLKRPGLVEAVVDQLKAEDNKFSSKIHVRMCLDGGYHVLDEPTHYSSDLRPTARQLWKPAIGVVELGILRAEGLHPAKTREGKGTCDPYCVAKYGQKWVRTRTIINEANPRFNEQYHWDVYDHATVLTVGVFDNSQIDSSFGNGSRSDTNIGKIRIRLSTLQTGRVYSHSYPLLVLHNSGVKKTGELHLAIRFSSLSVLNTMYLYTRPLLPKMHYHRPIPILFQDRLRQQAVEIVAARLSRMEPPLRPEVVKYMSDAHSHLWSLRRSKAHFNRLLSVFSGVFAVTSWFRDVCAWKNRVTTVLVHILFTMLVCYPELILPTVFLYMFLIGVWNYRFRPRHPPHMNTKLSHADAVSTDELDEEFDTFPTSRNPELVRRRYDRLRSVAGRIQMIIGDIATQAERVHLLLSWRDPRATAMFLCFCLVAAAVLYVMPFQVLVFMAGVFLMRHPRFRHRLPSAPVNFFRRLPARTDSLL